MSVSLTLPYPPSLNSIFRQHNGARLSEKYRAWRDEAGWMLVAQRPAKIDGPVSVSVSLVAPDKRRRDLDNVGFKAVVDLLVKHEIIEADDSRIVRKIQAEWASTGEPCTVIVTSVRGHYERLTGTACKMGRGEGKADGRACSDLAAASETPRPSAWRARA